MQQSERECHITWHPTPPTPAQEQAWRWLWARLLGHIAPGPETPQPQDLRGPEAATVATVDSGHNFLSELVNDNTPHNPST